jgi:hypothetical protein
LRLYVLEAGFDQTKLVTMKWPEAHGASHHHLVDEARPVVAPLVATALKEWFP